MKSNLFFLLFFSSLYVTYSVHNILDYGAIPQSDSTVSAFKNSQALINAIQAANQSEDRDVLVPAGYAFTMMSIEVSHLYNITIIVDGKIFFSNDDRRWPRSQSNRIKHFWEINDSSNLQFRGQGSIDGRGYMWWWREILVINHDGRPHMIVFNRVTNVVFQQIKLLNCPNQFIVADDIDGFEFYDFEIYVDIFLQKTLLSDYGHWDFKRGLPTFPLNTDGIDPAGQNVYIKNVTFTLFDDAVAVKPARQGFKYSSCSQNILVENCTVNFAVGMTIGTVPPHPAKNCIKDVYFRDIIMNYPFKAIYVKTNPGSGYGLIKNITYENFQIYKPIWWGIYIGPQQQKQPDGGGPGCMIYPLSLDCPTQPLVTVEDITLRNITIHGSLLTPGIIRCHEDNPCRNIRFENVYHNAWYKKVGLGFIVENVYGESINSYPDPGFKRIVKEE